MQRRIFTRLMMLWFLVTLVACGGSGPPASTVRRVVITPGTFLLTTAGQVRQLTATAYDAQGKPVQTPLSWSSTAAAQLSVDGGGQVTAHSLGSAQIVAEAGGVRSAPAFAVVADPRPGALLVTDAQVLRIGPPLNRAAGAYPGVGSQYQVSLTGVSGVSVGTVVLAAETAAVAGKVVSSRAEGAALVVLLETVALPALFDRYHLDWTVDLSPYDIVMDGEPLQGNQMADGGQGVSTFAPLKPLAEEKLFDRTFPPKGPSPFKCQAKIAAYISSSLVDIKLSGTPTLVYQTFKDDAGLPPGYTKLALVGDLTLSGKLGFKAEAGFTGSGKCELVGRLPIPVLGPWSVLIAPAIPVGVGASISGKLVVSSLELTLEGKNGAALELGVVCGPVPLGCRSLDKVEPINELKPTVQIPLPPENAMRAELSGSVYLLSGLEVLALGTPFSLVEATFGPVQSANLAFVGAQANDPGYASSYDLKLEAKASPGANLAKAIETLTGEDVGNLGFDFSLTKPLSTSPTGTLSSNKSQVRPGDLVNLTVDLAAASTEYFLLGYNVESIELYRRLEGTSDFVPFRSIPVSASGGQTRFQDAWTPTQQEAGINEIAAFVKTRMPVVELEIAPNSVIKVDVKCSVGALGAAALTPAASTCTDSWVGTASYMIKTPGLPTANIAATANITWIFDRALSGNGAAYYRASGTFDLAFNSPDNCTRVLSPRTFAIVNDPTTPALLGIINDGVNPPTYGFGGAQLINFTITESCPGREDGVTRLNNFQVFYAKGSGPLVDPLRISGTYEDAGEAETWNFSRP